MIGWILRLLLLIIVIRLIWRFLAGIIDGLTPPDQRASGSKSGNGKNGKSVPLVRDPVCGTYIVREKALTLDARGETLYFCSTRCRDEYARRGTGARPLREAK